MSARPIRLQLSRRKGFDLQAVSRAANGLPAVNVARPTVWGNYAALRIGVLNGPVAVIAFRTWIDREASWAWIGRARINLCGRNLACWCAPGVPCHADVLLELANGPPIPRRPPLRCCAECGSISTFAGATE